MTTLGWTPFILPSRGVLYGDKLPGGVVELRPLNAKQQSLLQQQGGGVLGKLDALIDASCRFPVDAKPADGKPLKHKELLLNDRFAILLALRTKTFGPTYTFKWRCRCGKNMTSTIDITEELDEKIGVEGETVEPFEVVLPERGTTLKLRFLRGTDEEIVTKNAKRVAARSNDSDDPSYLFRIAMQLVEEVGAAEPFKDIVQKQQFIEALHAKDLIALEDGVTAVEPGIDPRLSLDCNKCESTNEMVMPFTAEFFRPRRSGN